MFPTQTHPGKVPEGPGLARTCRRALAARDAPPSLIGVGGVDAANAAALVEVGCDGVAVIRGILDAPDPEAAAPTICRALASDSSMSIPAGAAGIIQQSVGCTA